MSGFLGFGQSGEESASIGQLNNLFNYGLNTANNNQNAGQNTVNQSLQTLQGPEAYYQSLLSAGRQQTQQNAAPAINTELSSADAQKRQQATTGTGRTGGTAELNREQGATTSSNIDNIINQQLFGQKQAGAQGLQGIAGQQAQVGGLDLQNAIANLGIASGGVENLYSGAIAKEGAQGSAVGGLLNTGLEAGASFALASALGLI
jgi:hypothetical protein